MARTAAGALSLLLAGAACLPAGEAGSFTVDAAASRVRINLGRAGLLKFLGHDHDIDAPVAETRMRGPEVLDLERHPEIAFVSQSVAGMRATGEVEWRLRDVGIEPPSVAGVVKVANRFRVAFDVEARREGGVIQQP